MPLTDAEKKAAQRQRDAKAGLVRVELKVPADKVDALRAYAKTLCE